MLAAVGIHHKWLAGVSDVKKRHTPAQFDMPLVATEVHGNGAVSPQRHFDLGVRPFAGVIQ